MLTEAYIEALLVDEELADLVWEALVANSISPTQARDATIHNQSYPVRRWCLRQSWPRDGLETIQDDPCERWRLVRRGRQRGCSGNDAATPLRFIDLSRRHKFHTQSFVSELQPDACSRHRSIERFAIRRTPMKRFLQESSLGQALFLQSLVK